MTDRKTLNFLHDEDEEDTKGSGVPATRDLFLGQKVDGRNQIAKRFRQTYQDVVEHLGGWEKTSFLQKQLAKSLAGLIIKLEMLQTEMVTEETADKDIEKTVNTICKTAATLGLEKIPAEDDSTIDIDRWIQSKDK